MAARDDLTYVEIADWTPGIFDDWYAAGGASRAKPGSARLTGTFGCCASRSGTLIPGPRRVNQLLGSPTVDISASLDGTERIMAFKCMSPVWDRTGITAFTSGEVQPYPDLLAFAFESFTDGPNFHHRSTLRVYKMFEEVTGSPAKDTVAVYDVGSSNDAGPFTANLKYGWSSIDITRDNYSNFTDPGFPIVAMTFTSNKNVLTYNRLAYPDTAAGNTDSSHAITGLDQPGGFAAYAIVAHQDRIIALDRSVNITFGATGEVPTDMLIGTTVNDITTTEVTLTVFVNENPGLFGAWATVNASELFLVKQQRGGYVIRGDVNNPSQVVRLPGLPSTYEAINLATSAPNGKVYYGSRNGVYAWSGGDTAELVSRQLNGWFWKPGDKADDVLHCKGSFASVDRFLFAPNNFFMDLETGGWWRLNDGDDDNFLPYAFYDVSATGNVIAAPNYLSTTQDVLADYYDILDGQSDYQFTSQPFEVSKNRSLDFREVNIKLRGTGQVTIELFGSDSPRHEPVVFQLEDQTEPTTISEGIMCSGTDVYFRLVASSLDDDTPAPEVLSLSFGYRPSQTARAL